MIYLDNAATTKALDVAVNAMQSYMSDYYFNPSAGYAQALKIKKDLNDATEKFAKLLNADASEIIFTSCASESNNFAFECGYKNKKGNVVVSSTEHASVYESAMRLKSKGYDVRFAKSEKDGRTTVDSLRNIVDANTSFVSILHASNETGTINDVTTLSSFVKSVNKNAIFHSDGVQAFCKIDTDVKNLGVDLYSMSAHKVGGMKGVGALYVKNGLNLQPFIVGGGQQNGRRSGTENVGGIIGFANAAVEYKAKSQNFDAQKLRNIFVEKFSSLDCKINGSHTENSGYILSASFRGLRGEIISRICEQSGVLIGLGSACSTHVKSNRVLTAMGVDKSYSDGSIRISLSPFTTIEDVKVGANVIYNAVISLKESING